jgi:hypothetical protein
MIRVEGGESILNIPYAEMTVDPDLIAGFVTAVIIFAKAPIRTIRKAAYDILIELKEHVLILLVVDPVTDEAPFRDSMLRVLDEFEEIHGNRLSNFEGDIRVFRESALLILKEFPYMKIDLDLIPQSTKGEPIGFRVGKIDKKLEKLDGFINGKRTVGEILDLIDLPQNEVIGLFSILAKFHWIEFKKRISDDDILDRVRCSEDALKRLKMQYGKPLEELLECFNGSRTIKDILDILPYDRSACWFLINRLVDIGCLAHAQEN